MTACDGSRPITRRWKPGTVSPRCSPPCRTSCPPCWRQRRPRRSPAADDLMSNDAVVRVSRSDALALDDRIALRALLDAAFAGDFSDEDWAHALGGTHAFVETEGAVVAHASVVPRVLDVGTLRLRAGYVEAVAVRPDRQGTGLGTAVMRALDE